MNKASKYFTPAVTSDGAWQRIAGTTPASESFYRNRWRYDKVVRSTHGVNCTGSCSWKVYVKDGLVTWETQQTDYPSIGEDTPQYEPRGCPRGASFSWYIYSPIRVRYPYVRGALFELWQQARAEHDDLVDAWASIVEDPERSNSYKQRRGRGGFERATWDDVLDIIAASHVYTIKKYGPDRVAGFSPIPAMSMASYAGGARFFSLIGATILSFYDWYADLPPASPQIWGDQTDVPEAADWWNASYLMLWGSNLPVTRTPDAHFMTEARYKGQKVVVVSPDYSDHCKFADDWLAAQPGTDGALAMAMGHVMLKEFYVNRQVPYFTNYAKTYTDLPFLVRLREVEGGYVADRFLRGSDLGDDTDNAAWKTCVLDAHTGAVVIPNGSVGFRYGAQGEGKWNLELGEIDPALTLYHHPHEAVTLLTTRFDVDGGRGGVLRRGVPATRIGDALVTTSFDLLLAQYGVSRPNLPGEWPADYDDASSPYTPAWQEAITSVDAQTVTRIAREFASNAEQTRGRSMICMGAGTNHWFHSDQIYRSFITLLLLCGCQGRNGGGWAHYVGQEKVRPQTGLSTIAFATDWSRPARQQAATPFWYLASSQWRYEQHAPAALATPLGRGLFDGRSIADCNALAARMGWLPSFPTFNRSSLDLCDEAAHAGSEVADHVVRELRDGRLRFAAEDPDAPENFPRVLTCWRANILGSSSKGNEYFLKHLLGVPETADTAQPTPPQRRPQELVWRDEIPAGKLDLMVTIDFRMTGTCLYSDIVLPAATWYEKYDLSSTDMHPFVHAFNAAIPPLWESKTDWECFNALARRFSELATKHLGTRKDVVASPLAHDSPDEIAQPLGEVHDWKGQGVAPVPGRTMPKLMVVERDYGAIAQKMTAVGPLVDELGTVSKGIVVKPIEQVEHLRRHNGTVTSGVAEGRPKLERAEHVCEAILALSGTTNGKVAQAGFAALSRRTGLDLGTLVEEKADYRISFADTQVQPRTVMTSHEWSGIESHDRRYSPFTINVDYKKPWHTLTGRQHFYVDHEWMREFGEALPVYRPPLVTRDLDGGDDATAVTVRFLTPHSKWSIHSEYQDNLTMLTLFRGGPVVWMSPADAARIGVSDNEWIEAVNSNGIIAARAVVSHRVPAGIVLMYHSQDRHLNVPLTQRDRLRGGTDNALTHISMKPTHMIGGYAQLSYGFNYYGPCGTQRDEVTRIRKRTVPVEY